MNLKYRKLLKVATLLATAAMIATVSAQVYSYMFIEGSGTITTGGMSWAAGTGVPGGATVTKTRVTNLNLSILQDTPQNFTDCLQLVSDSSPHTFDLAATVTGGNTSKFTTFDMVVSTSATGGTRIATINIMGSGSASSLSISASQTLYVRFEVVPLTGETTGTMAFTVTLTYE